MMKIYLEGFKKETSDSNVQNLETKLQDIEYATDYLDDYVAQPGMIEKLKNKREIYTLPELEKYVENSEVDELVQKVSNKEQEINRLNGEN